MKTHENSALYLGRVRHRRQSDPQHSFSYPVWHVLFDIDLIPDICAQIPFLSHNRFNLLGFADRDHLHPEKASIREKLTSFFKDRALQAPAGKVMLLTGLRHLGYGFNPVSFFFCYDEKSQLQHVVAEVNNTFGERYCYLLDADGNRRVISQQCEKKFHVSPFNPVDGAYRFRITSPGDRVTVHIDLLREGKRVFDATLSSERAPLSKTKLLRALLSHAHLSAFSVARIHWQALKLWIKGATFHKKPTIPKTAWRTHHG